VQTNDETLGYLDVSHRYFGKIVGSERTEKSNLVGSWLFRRPNCDSFAEKWKTTSIIFGLVFSERPNL
jgi:hypothetical protein